MSKSYKSRKSSTSCSKPCKGPRDSRSHEKRVHNRRVRADGQRFTRSDAPEDTVIDYAVLREHAPRVVELHELQCLHAELSRRASAPWVPAREVVEEVLANRRPWVD